MEFLTIHPSRKRLMQALFANMKEWIVRSAEMSGSCVLSDQGLLWTHHPTTGDAIIAFPEFHPDSVNQQIEQIIDYYRAQEICKDVLFWSMQPLQPENLEARLIARGFEWNWQPHWMWMPLAKLPLPGTLSTPPNLHIKIHKNTPVLNTEDIPYYKNDGSEREQDVSSPFVWHLSAWLEDKAVGHSIMNLTTGPLGVAGIFDVGVDPTARNQGVGKALTFAACQLALSQGCRHAVLNATPMGEPVYHKLGFTSLGYGYTWLLSKQALQTPPSSPALVAYAEAVCSGDMETLTQMYPGVTLENFDEPLPNGFTLLQLASRMGQHQTAEWLLVHGASLDLIAAWDLGWTERARQLVATKPEIVNERWARMQLTPLHIAVERNDVELARLVLSGQPDLTLEDTHFHATALSWAKHMQRQEMMDLMLKMKHQVHHR